MRITAAAALLSGLALGACSMADFESFRPPDAATLFRPLSVTSFRDKPLPPVTQDDLVDSSGRCAGMYAPREALVDPAGAPGGVPSQSVNAATTPVAIALDMTECDIVKRAGPAQQVQIGSAGGERTATLTYIGGARPGIYHFTSGRLTSMERGPEPPPEPKPAKRAPKSKRTATR